MVPEKAETPAPSGGEGFAAAAADLDRIAAPADGLLDIDTATLAAVDALARDAPDDPRLPWLQDAHDAVAYMLRVDRRSAAFEPYLLLADGTCRPPRLEDQPDDKIARWALLRTATAQPAWRSRLGHLVIESGRVVTGKDRVSLADDTANAYLLAPPGWGSGLDLADALRSAAGLARQFGLRDRRQQALAAIADAARDELAGQAPAPGIVLGLTDYLVNQSDAPPGTDDLVQAARDHWTADIHNLDHAIAQQLVRVSKDPARRAELTAQRVRAWLDAAEAADAIRRASFLQTAVEHSAASGDPSLRREATARLQQMTLADLGMQSIRTGIVLRGEQIAAAARPVTDAADWAQALDRWALLGPPTGDAAGNRAAVAEQMRTSLSALFPRTTYGGDGLPRFSARTDDERTDYQLAQHETLGLQLTGPLIAEALLRLPVHHGLPPLDELAAHFARNPLVGAELAHALARCFHRWWAGDYEAAAFTAAPRVETLARDLLMARNLAIYRTQRAGAPGQYPGLGSLLATLSNEGVLDDSWHRYLHTLLTNPAGLNLRNELSHGFVDDADLLVSALVLQAAAHLAVIPLLLQTRADADADTDAAAQDDGTDDGPPAAPTDPFDDAATGA